MADLVRTGALPVRTEAAAVRSETVAARVRWAVRSWWLVAAMWNRSTMSYRLSFALMAVASTVITFLDFVVILLMFQHTHALGGWTLPELGFLYGTSAFALGAANLLVGTADALGERIRAGSLDTMLIRPAPALAQLCAERFTLRRLGRPVQATAVLVWSLAALDVDWTWDRVLLVPVLLVCGTTIFAAVFIGGATVQFWWGEAGELQNSSPTAAPPCCSTRRRSSPRSSWPAWSSASRWPSPTGCPPCASSIGPIRSACRRPSSTPRPSPRCSAAPSPASPGGPACARTAAPAADPHPLVKAELPWH